MQHLRTIITGCALYDEAQGSSVWGDLWSLGEVYIFNAVLRPNGEAAWSYGEKPQEGTKYVTVNGAFDEYFERRGVFVLRKISSTLSLAAQEYLK
jgi:hypothetical protein